MSREVSEAQYVAYQMLRHAAQKHVTSVEVGELRSIEVYNEMKQATQILNALEEGGLTFADRRAE